MTDVFEYSVYKRDELIYHFTDMTPEMAEEKKAKYEEYQAEQAKKKEEAAKAAAEAKAKADAAANAKPEADIKKDTQADKSDETKVNES